eukprot:gene17010-8515_t
MASISAAVKTQSLTALKNSWIFSKRFKWSKEHDILMLRDVNASEIWMTKPGSMERGDGWKQIADRLNKIESPNFECTARSVRENFQTLIEKRKVVNREEERASGISPEITEVDILLDELLEVFSSAAFDQQAAEKEKVDKRVEDVEKAKELRQQSLETLGETQKKMREDAEIKREELELKKRDRGKCKAKGVNYRGAEREGWGGLGWEKFGKEMLQNQQHHSQMLTDILRRLEKNY